MRQCTEVLQCPLRYSGVLKDTSLHSGNVLKESACPLPIAGRQCTKGYPLPTSPCNATAN